MVDGNQGLWTNNMVVKKLPSQCVLMEFIIECHAHEPEPSYLQRNEMIDYIYIYTTCSISSE